MKLHPLALLLSTALAVPAAMADTLTPVRLRVAGAEVRGVVPTVADDNETYAPLELLPAVGLKGEVAPKRDTVIVTGGTPARRGELRLVRRNSQQMLVLSEVARFLDAEVRRPGRIEKDGLLAPAKPGDWVYLLARVRRVRVENGAVEVTSSFPVPAKAGSIEEPEALRDYVEYTGAVLPEGVTPAPAPQGEPRVRSLRAEQTKPDVVRVTLDLFDGAASACGPEALAQAPGKTPPAPLLLDDVLRQVQAVYPKLAGADAERRTAAAKRQEKEGAFDPLFTTGSDYTRFPSSDKLGVLKAFTASQAGVEVLTPSGIRVIAGGRLNQGDVKAPFSPTGTAGEYFVGVKLPLLRGAGINEKSAELRQSRLGVPLADTEFDETRLAILQKAAHAYWDWVAAGRRVAVARELLSLARTRAGAVRERANAGDLPLIDVTEADQEVQRRTEGLRKSERELQKETFKLSLFLWEADGKPSALPSVHRIPAATAPAGELKDEEVRAARDAALNRRPELGNLAAARKIVEVDLDLARNQRLPQVDLTLAPGLDTGFGGAGSTIKAGVALGLPLRQRTAEGRIQQAELKRRKLDLDLELARQQIVTEVEDAASAIRMTYQRYRAAVEELELARKLEQGERDRFALGDSTLFLVNQRERATAEAAVKTIGIQAEYEQALATFGAVTAQL